VRRLNGLTLAVLLCAALDTYLTRAGHAYRPQDWLLPGQALLLWAAFGVLLALPMRWTFRREGAGLTAALAWMAGAVALHGLLAAKQAAHGRISVTGDGPLFLGALAALVALGWIGARLERVLATRARAVGLGLALTLGALAVVSFVPRGGPAVRERAAGPATTARPNVLLLVWDTTRADHLPDWGDERSLTPALSRLVRQSQLFETAWSASVFTLSSHVSMLTGLPPALHGTTMRRQQVTAETVAPIFAAAGYRTGAFVGTAVLTGAGGLREGFDVYDDLVDPPVCDTRLWAMVNDAQVLGARMVPALRHDGQPHWWQDFQRPAGEVLADASRWIAEGGAEPWFAVVNLFDAHWPYEPSSESRALWVRPYGGPLTGHLFRADDWPPGRAADASDKVHARDLYDSELWDLDRATGAFLDGLDLTSGATAVLLTADHGEALGEHDEWSHEHPRVPQSRVPLLVCAPGRVAPGSRVSAPVSGVDVAPTLLDLAGLTPPDGFAPLGRSLLAQPLPDDRLLFVQDHDNEYATKDEDAVVQRRFKLLRTRDGSTLHDTVVDPLDEVDLTSQQPALAAELGAALDSLQAATPAEGGAVIDEDTLRALGYVGH